MTSLRFDWESELRDFYVFQSNPKENINLLTLSFIELVKKCTKLYFGVRSIHRVFVQILNINVLERKVGQQAAHWLQVMPGVQNKYSIDVINRFAIEDDDVEDEDAENIDRFEELKALNQKAEDAKNAPKPKVIKSYTYSIRWAERNKPRKNYFSFFGRHVK